MAVVDDSMEDHTGDVGLFQATGGRGLESQTEEAGFKVQP